MEEKAPVEVTVGKDPISGNDIPAGAMPEEVRDDIDAKLSVNEFVVPADVVRYFGVKYFEDLRAKAKKGMAEMHESGRIQSQGSGDELSEEDMALLEETLQMNEGGLVGKNNFDYSAASLGGNFQNPYMTTDQGTEPASPTQGGFETKVFKNAGGDTKYILFINGVPINAIPDGYTEEGTDPVTTEEEAKQEYRPEDMGDFSLIEQSGQGERRDIADMTTEELTRDATFGLKAGDFLERTGGQMVGGLLGGPIGALLGRNIGGQIGLGLGTVNAMVNLMELEARNETEAANKLRSQIEKSTKKSIDELRQNERVQKAWGRAKGTTPTGVPAAPAATPQFSSSRAKSTAPTGVASGLASANRDANEAYSSRQESFSSAASNALSGPRDEYTGHTQGSLDVMGKAIGRGASDDEIGEISKSASDVEGALDAMSQGVTSIGFYKGGLVTRPPKKKSKPSKRKGLATR